MKKLSLFSALLFFMYAADCQNNYWQQKTDYTISVSLNDADNSITGYEEIDYYNNSPDTLRFIWIHLWPNAYKNDRTAFSDQLLENGRTDFYFSGEDKKGYINRLAFTVNGIKAATADHPQHQDIVKLILPQPLPPGQKIKIATPFHVKLPYNFSRGGHVQQSYQLTQWYPKPAVYDKTGWHEMPYLDQGEFYSEFGNFDVHITVPENYIVAATGELQNEEEKAMLQRRAAERLTEAVFSKRKTAGKILPAPVPASSQVTKTLHYKQDNVHDFAWFADKTFLVKVSKIILKNGHSVDAYAFILPENKGYWDNSMEFIKRALQTKSDWIGNYPYNTVSVVDNASPIGGGMEYPTVTLLTAGGSEAALESVINHEVGHNWFYGILGTDERRYPFMDEGFNTYYDNRYDKLYPQRQVGDTALSFLKMRLPADESKLALTTSILQKKDQPITASSENFTENNYNLIAYNKTGEWLQKLENELGKDVFDKVMHAYYEKWKFKHPYPEDFKAVAEEISGRQLTNTFAYLDRKGSWETEKKRPLRFASFFNFKDGDKFRFISIAPAVGFNYYDKLMAGVLIHNYNLPPGKFQFFAAPLYATGTQKINGIGRAEYNWFPGSKGNKITLALAGAKFTGDSFKDSTGKKNPLSFSKTVPSVKYVFAPKNPRSHVIKSVQWKTYLIKETNLLFSTDTFIHVNTIAYPKVFRYLNQLELAIENSRVLYPYKGILQAEQGDGFVRLNFTGNYFFNYANSGGLAVRFFAGKFIYTADKSFSNRFKTDRYHLNLSGPKGYEDYTYSNYFTGRNEFEGFSNQQIMQRDGFFKVRTDLLSSKIGKTDDWLSAVNLTTDIPDDINPLKLLPVKIPLRLFADVGTFSEAWKKNSGTGRFLYDAGIQLSLFNNVLNVYMPVIYSKVYGDYFKSTIPDKRLVKNISFTIDLKNIKIPYLLP